MPFAWTPAMLDHLFRLYVREGRSAAETARAIGHGVTRNAVLGKAQRMGWTKPRIEDPLAPTAVKRPRLAAVRGRRRDPFGRPIPLPVLREIPLLVAPRPWTERAEGQCAYPVGEPARPSLQLSCCAPTRGGEYCPAHRALMALPDSRLTARDVDVIVEIARRAA